MSSRALGNGFSPSVVIAKWCSPVLIWVSVRLIWVFDLGLMLKLVGNGIFLDNSNCGGISVDPNTQNWPTGAEICGYFLK